MIPRAGYDRTGIAFVGNTVTRRAMKSSILRRLLGSIQRLRKLAWRFTGRPAGAHAIVLTSTGMLVLVRLRYASGWRPPGGGIKKGEEVEQAVLRELKEEIGMIRHGAVEADLVIRDPGGDRVFIVRDVEYSPRWSLEVEAVAEFSPSHLPLDIAPRARRWIDQVRHHL